MNALPLPFIILLLVCIAFFVKHIVVKIVSILLTIVILIVGAHYLTNVI